MAFEPKPNTGALFTPQGKKTPNDRYPDRTGNALITCPECNRNSAFWVSAWIKTSDSGRKWLSMAFSPKTSTTPSAAPTPRSTTPEDY